MIKKRLHTTISVASDKYLREHSKKKGDIGIMVDEALTLHKREKKDEKKK